MANPVKGDGLLHMDPTIRTFKQSETDLGFEELGIQIIKKAALDYVEVIKSLYRETDKRKILDLLSVKSEIERFFQGNWYFCLTSVDSKHLVQRIREMARTELLAEIKAKYSDDALERAVKLRTGKGRTHYAR